MTISQGTYSRINPAVTKQYFIKMDTGKEYLFTGSYQEAKLHEWWHYNEQDQFCYPATKKEYAAYLLKTNIDVSNFGDPVQWQKETRGAAVETTDEIKKEIKAFKELLIEALKAEEFSFNITDELLDYIEEFGEISYFVFSPDGFSFQRPGEPGFKTVAEASQYFWTNIMARYEHQPQGYSTIRNQQRYYIPLRDLNTECCIKEYVGGDGYTDNTFDIEDEVFVPKKKK